MRMRPLGRDRDTFFCHICVWIRGSNVYYLFQPLAHVATWLFTKTAKQGAQTSIERDARVSLTEKSQRELLRVVNLQ